MPFLFRLVCNAFKYSCNYTFVKLKLQFRTFKYMNFKRNIEKHSTGKL